MPDSAHGSLWHRHFERVICVLLMWPPFFFRGHPYIWRTAWYAWTVNSVNRTHDRNYLSVQTWILPICNQWRMPKWWIAVMCFWILNQPVHRINCPCMNYVYLPETQITNGLLKGQFPFYRIAEHNKGVSLSHHQLHWIIHAFANNNAACMWNKYI